MTHKFSVVLMEKLVFLLHRNESSCASWLSGCKECKEEEITTAWTDNETNRAEIWDVWLWDSHKGKDRERLLI